MVKTKLLATVGLSFLACIFLDTCGAWSGHYTYYRRVRSYYYRSYCICWYRYWGCSAWRYRFVRYYYNYYQCLPGWRHNGNQNCNIPVCYPSCGSGTCISPNTCQCPYTSTGRYCREATCSYPRPCYPGDCMTGGNCACQAGFKNATSLEGPRYSCINFDPAEEKMYPVIGKCTATILNTDRIHNTTNYMFIMDGTNIEDRVEQVWSNQQRFNILQFDFESLFPELEGLPDRPPYVFSSGFGIVHAQVEVNITKHPRDPGALMRDPGYYRIYNCSGMDHENPEKDLANCTINDDQFVTLIEHGDWMEVAYQATSGGFRELRNIDNQNKPYATDHFKGLNDIKRVKFLFDFYAPKYCGDDRFYVGSPCPPNAVILEVQEEFTRNPIRPHWLGWIDDLSGMLEYYVEIFKLYVNADGRLVEERPINPDFSILVSHNNTIAYPEYTPDKSGIYSVLLEARDMSNNSVTARRFCVYDPDSEITISQENSKKLYMSSASEKTDYVWQTTGRNGADGPITFTARWDNHFVNPTHEQGGFLNVIEKYPIQFEDIDASGVLSSKKYVSEEYDDYEGKLTRHGITNFHGIVKFEVIKQASILDDQVPVTGWVDVSPLAETYSFSTNILDGDSFRLWVRATDEMGNSETDSTVVHVDTTGPAVTADNSTDLRINYDGSDATYDYTSRIQFLASDGDSGVHEIHYTITVESFGKADKVMFTGNQSANFQPASAHCPSAQKDGFCYKPQQILDLNNCWFIVDKDDLATSIATVLVTVYNRAMMADSFTVDVHRVNMLRGLEEYTGPENFRVEETKSEKFRIAWDLPEKVSCYGLTDIVLVIVEEETNRTETVYIHSTKRYFDMPANPNTKYTVTTAMQLAAGNSFSLGTSLAVQTPEEPNTGLPAGAVAGVAIAVIAIVAISMVVFVVLIRNGHCQPVTKKLIQAKAAVESAYVICTQLGSTGNQTDVS